MFCYGRTLTQVYFINTELTPQETCANVISLSLLWGSGLPGDADRALSVISKAGETLWLHPLDTCRKVEFLALLGTPSLQVPPAAEGVCILGPEKEIIVPDSWSVLSFSHFFHQHFFLVKYGENKLLGLPWERKMNSERTIREPGIGMKAITWVFPWVIYANGLQFLIVIMMIMTMKELHKWLIIHSMQMRDLILQFDWST